jgi:hypothetical protein
MQSVPIEETHDGKLAWVGVVRIFAIDGQDIQGLCLIIANRRKRQAPVS